ncbi:HEAT repeat-containing protein 2, partial [Cladochytrium tenue]
MTASDDGAPLAAAAAAAAAAAKPLGSTAAVAGVDDVDMHAPGGPSAAAAAGPVVQVPLLAPALEDLRASILRSLQRDTNILAEPTSDRASKRRALEKIRRETVARGNAGLAPPLASALLLDLARPLLRCLVDSVEKCRELAARILADRFTPLVDNVVPSLPYTLPVLSLRLGQPEITEPSEEIRCLLVSLLAGLVDSAGRSFAPGVDDTVKILSRTLADPFADVKKESCKVSILLCRHVPQALVHHVPTVAKALLGPMQHRHSAVRVQALKALQEIVIVDASAAFHQDTGVLACLTAMTLDAAPSVREQLYATAAAWLLRIPDRYPLGYKVLPVLFAGLSDEVGRLASGCTAFLEEAGKLYEVEWEDRVKDELDYTTGIDLRSLEVGKCRPRVGARHLARDNCQKLVTRFVEGMQDWSPDTRAKSAASLAAFIPYAENNITGYVGTILPALYRVLAEDDPAVVKETSKVAAALGRFVAPDLSANLVLSHLAAQVGSTTTARAGCLRTLCLLLEGAPPRSLWPSSATLAIASALAGSPAVAADASVALLAEAARTAHVLTAKMNEAATAAVVAGVPAPPVGEEG